MSARLGNGDGTFKAIVGSSTGGGGNVQVADFNKDGNMDLAVANNGSANVSIFTNASNLITFMPSFTEVILDGENRTFQTGDFRTL